MAKTRVLWPDWRSSFYNELMPRVFLADQLELVTAEMSDPIDLPSLVREIEIIVVKSRPVTGDVISAGNRLRLVLKYGTVVENIDLEAAAKAGIAVGIFPLPHLIPVAEHAILLMLALGKNLLRAHQAVQNAEYPSHLESVTTSEHIIRYNWMQFANIEPLYEKTLGLVGLGEIGLATAKIARSFNMRILYHKRHRFDEKEECRLGLAYSSLGDLLRQSDFISLHAVHTPETERMIGRREIALMKSSAFLVNTARGGLIDQDALVDALKARTIAGAGLDVYREEPPPKGSPLLELDNVILTPHISGGRGETLEVTFHELFQKLARISDGEPLSDVFELIVQPRNR